MEWPEAIAFAVPIMCVAGLAAWVVYLAAKDGGGNDDGN